MEIAEVTLNGQITIPEGIREKMSLKRGDKIIFLEENGRFFLENSNSAALSAFQKNMTGAAQEAGFNCPDDVEEYIKQLRKSKRN
ncbi:MAG: AbrB/MazE/SpoVT family DNA-binding domain-containing protein [Treponema sp.]|jgi:AbrB family looped-hinge helix DNA binding protein|nr:AbrB/MazE/SpoVT family DNA-binding domain-containing protein [Treponema sp.]